MAPPTNPNYETAKTLIDAYDGGASGARESAARNVNAINEGGNEFFGSNTNPAVRDRIRQARLFRNNMDLGRNLMDAKNNEIAYKNAGYMSLGGATAPQLVQTGGTQNSQMYGGLGQQFAGNFLSSAGSSLGS